MPTAEQYTRSISEMPQRAAEWAEGLKRRERQGCCDPRGENQYVVEVDTFGERGQLISHEAVVKCHVTGEICPRGNLALLAAMYRHLNGRR